MKYYIYIILYSGIFVCSYECGTADSSKNTNTIYFKNLSQTQYTINDTVLKLTEKGSIISLKYTLLDSGRLEKEPCKIFYIVIPDFTKLASDTLRQKTVLAIGKKISGCEIHVLESREVYSALITSDLRGEKGAANTELIKNSWRYDYVLK